MEDEFNSLNEKDAVPTGVTSSAMVNRSEEVIEGIETNVNNQIVNNNMMLTQRNQSSSVTFNGCSGVTFGTVVNVGWSPGNSKISKPVKTTARLDDSVYQKTPTIKAMLGSNEPISSAYLNFVSANLGSRWKELTILLDINQLFVELMYEDYFERGGIREVVFNILSQYLKDHQDNATVGWLTTYLWKNGFKKTVWTVKEHYKALKRLESECDD